MPGIEIILVNDGSTDETDQVVAQYEGRITVHKQRNMGVCVARNAGLARSSGEYVTFIDVDDWVEPDYCEQMAAALDANPDAAAVYCDRVEVNDYEGRLEPFRTVHLRDRTKDTLRSFIPECFIGSPGATMIRRGALEAVGGFDPAVPNIGEDWDLCLKLAKYYPWAYVPKPLFHYRFHPHSATKQIYIRMLEGASSVVDRYTKLARDGHLYRRERKEAYRNLRRRAAENWLRFFHYKRGSGELTGRVLRAMLGELWRHPELIVWVLGIGVRRSGSVRQIRR